MLWAGLWRKKVAPRGFRQPQVCILLLFHTEHVCTPAFKTHLERLGYKTHTAWQVWV